MMRRPAMLARVGPAQRALLPTETFKPGGIQIQTVSRRTFRQPLQLPVPQAGEKMLALPLAETFEQVANSVVDRKASDPEQLVQGYIGTQQTGVCEPPRPGHHREQEGREGPHRLTRGRRAGAQGKMLPSRLAER